jgi:hypothetical protein
LEIGPRRAYLEEVSLLRFSPSLKDSKMSSPAFSLGDRVKYTRNKDGIVILGVITNVHTKAECKTRRELGLFYNPQLLGEEFAYVLDLSEQDKALVGCSYRTLGESRLQRI